MFIVASMNGMKIGLEVESVREIIDVNEKTGDSDADDHECQSELL